MRGISVLRHTNFCRWRSTTDPLINSIRYERKAVKDVLFSTHISQIVKFIITYIVTSVWIQVALVFKLKRTPELWTIAALNLIILFQPPLITIYNCNNNRRPLVIKMSICINESTLTRAYFPCGPHEDFSFIEFFPISKWNRWECNLPVIGSR